MGAGPPYKTGVRRQISQFLVQSSMKTVTDRNAKREVRRQLLVRTRRRLNKSCRRLVIVLRRWEFAVYLESLQSLEGGWSVGRLPIFVWSGRRRRQESPGTIDGTVAVESVRCTQLLAYLRTNAVSVDCAELAVDVAE